MGSSVKFLRKAIESSAKCPNFLVISPISIPVIFWSLLMDLVNPSIIVKKRIGESRQPWAVP
eukprot:4228283-Pleurochrysis_carterae.AAC.1